MPACEANSELEAEVGLGLYDLAARSPTVPLEFIAALGDPSACRRAIASCIVARRGAPGERAKVRALLQDPVSIVRLRAGQGLLAAGDFAAVPALIALLDILPCYEAGQAEELLRWLSIGAGPDREAQFFEPAGALTYRLVWEQWWKGKRDTIDFAAVRRQPRRPCLFMVSAPESMGLRNGLAPVTGCDGGLRYHLRIPSVRQIAQVLPNGRLLVIGNSVNVVLEID